MRRLAAHRRWFVFGGLSNGAATGPAPETDYSIDAQRCVVYVRFGRTLGLAEIELYAKALAANPLFSPTFSEIVDLTAVKDLQLDAEAAVSLADQVDPFDLASKRAFIATSAPQVHAARIHQILWSEKSIKIFDCEAAAREWLQTP
jgi:hypothetical protein